MIGCSCTQVAITFFDVNLIICLCVGVVGVRDGSFVCAVCYLFRCSTTKKNTKDSLQKVELTKPANDIKPDS